MCDKRISDLIQLLAKKESLTEYEIEEHGKSGRGEGYLGQLNFVTVTGKTNNEEIKTLNLAIKTSAQHEVLRSQVPIKEIFELEIYIYDKVLPIFRHLQEEMSFKDNILELLPTCYYTQNFGNDEALILENLKFRGFDVVDRKIPLTFDHIQLVLESYGKWHAFSLALRHKRPETFKDLVKNFGNMWSTYMLRTKTENVYFQYYEEVRKFWENVEDVASVKFSDKEAKFILTSLVSEDMDHSVIQHGDCWTNNLMFKLDEATGKPKAVCLIDWQMSGLASPALDLSYFIYTCVDTDEHKNVKHLLKIYYDSLSKYLAQLDCNSEDVLPFDILLKHWRKFSSYGLLSAAYILRFCLSDSEELPDFTETAEKGKNFLANFDYKPSKPEAYYQRMKHNILHYARNFVE